MNVTRGTRREPPPPPEGCPKHGFAPDGGSLRDPRESGFPKVEWGFISNKQIFK